MHRPSCKDKKVELCMKMVPVSTNLKSAISDLMFMKYRIDDIKYIFVGNVITTELEFLVHT